MTEDQLEHEALGRLADVGYRHRHGPERAPNGSTPERGEPAVPSLARHRRGDAIFEWLAQANRKRFEQLDYIAQDNALAAADQDADTEQQVNMLLQQPKLGRPGRAKGTRELVIGHTPFIVASRIKGTQRIQILHLLDGSQLWPPKSA